MIHFIHNFQNMGLFGKDGLEDDTENWAKIVASHTSLLTW